MALTPPPTAPSTADPSTFAARADARIAWESVNVAELEALQIDVTAKQSTASAAATTATTQAGIATAKAVLTAADVVSTNADVVLTHADVVAAAASAASAAAIAGAFVGTSATSWTPTVGAQVFATQTGEQYTAGTFLSIVSAAAPTAWGVGQVTSYSGSTLTMDIQVINGTGAHTDWNISLTGTRGATGAPGTLAGTAVGTIELLTGANIASAATVNLDTATGNRVHITGVTTITAVTLTRGPRTVIFDGILTLTHHATTNNLPGAANITTAAGDRAIYESDGTTVYCVSYIKSNGLPVIAASSGVGDHEVVLTTGNGHGSTNTNIRRFTTTQTNVGTAITYADSATAGASLTINETGLYSLYYIDKRAAANNGYLGVSVNSAQLTTAIYSITAADRLMMAAEITTGQLVGISRVVRCVAGDVLRPHTTGDLDDTTANGSVFAIRKVGL